ncbi:MAG: class I SAM-dependent methyltransferase [Prevotella sp.]|nr:class I SAM-dependent methyltransferase [Prevotella sp.]
MNEFVSKDNWKDLDLNVDSLWMITERDKSGKHANVYHGNFIPQIPNQLIRRYTSEGDLVLELFSGSGTTLYECETLKRDYIGFDINEEIIEYVNGRMANTKSINYVVNKCDVTNSTMFAEYMSQSLKKTRKEHADFLIAHPPYMDIVKFSDKAEDLSNISDLTIFLDKLKSAFANALPCLEKGKYFSVVMGDVYKKSEVIPLGFYTMYMIKKNFKVKLKGVVVKNIEGNRGKLGQQNIWKYRAMKSDYYLFKHEYIFVFKKEF